MEDIESAPVKRGRGRPKGSLNKKTLARVNEEEAEVPVPFTLDVDFESNDILGEREPEEPASPPPPPPPKLKRAASKKKPTRILTPPPPQPDSAEESDDEPPPPKIKRVRRKPEAAVPPPVEQPPPTYLEVLTRGLRAAQATQKAQKVARYDAFFAR